MEAEELIKQLDRACDLFDEIQRRKAVLEAEEVIESTKEERQ